MTKNNRLDALNKRLKNSKPNHGWESDDGAVLAVRQVWTVAGGCGNQPGWSLLLLEKLNDEYANFAPLTAHAELAGPDDLFVPIDRTGVPGIVSLGQECTLNRDALDECVGRLPNQIFSHIIEARRNIDDPVARNAYEWGLSYFSPHSPCVLFHQTIAEIIERLQGSVRQFVYGGKESPLAFPNVPWSVFGQRFDLERLPKVADDGTKWTPCLLIKGAGEDGTAAESAASEALLAKLRNPFEHMHPEAEFCNEWEVHTSAENEPLAALIYLEGHERPIGNARVCLESNGFLVTLDKVDLAPEEPPITDPSQLRLVIFLAKQ